MTRLRLRWASCVPMTAAAAAAMTRTPTTPAVRNIVIGRLPERTLAPGCDRVHHERQRGHMVQMGMGQKHALDPPHFVQRQVTDTRAGIDQRVVIDQERRGPTVLCDGAGTA